MRIDLSRYDNFFFDFDGVITDSVDIKTQAFAELFSSYGKAVGDKVMEYHTDNGGISRYEKFKYYYAVLLNKKINQAIIRRLDRRFSQIVIKKVVSANYIKGAIEFIRALRRNNKPSFIITATPDKEIKRIIELKKIGGLFRDIAGSPRKKTESLSYLLGKHKINPRTAVYFGDAKSDYESARKNRVDFIGVVNNKSRELKRYSGLIKIKDFEYFNLRKESHA